MRKRIIECVLATDMAKHAPQVNWFKGMLESNEISKGHNLDKLRQIESN